MAENNNEIINMTTEDFDRMACEFIKWLENTDHKSFTYITSYDNDTHVYNWDVTVKFERRDD